MTPVSNGEPVSNGQVMARGVAITYLPPVYTSMRMRTHVSRSKVQWSGCPASLPQHVEEAWLTRAQSAALLRTATRKCPGWAFWKICHSSIESTLWSWLTIVCTSGLRTDRTSSGLLAATSVSVALRTTFTLRRFTHQKRYCWYGQLLLHRWRRMCTMHSWAVFRVVRRRCRPSAGGCRHRLICRQLQVWLPRKLGGSCGPHALIAVPKTTTHGSVQHR